MNLLILSGKNETPFFVDGWYGLEQSPEGILYRATKPHAFLTLPIDGEVELTLYISARPEHTHIPFKATVQIDGKQQADISLTSNHWTTKNVQLTLMKDSRIEFQTQTPWSPDTLYHNGDIRALGMLVSSVRVNVL